MYRPAAFKEDRPDVLRAAIRRHPLGTLVTGGRSGLIANFVPFSLMSRPEGDVLHAHLARANDQIGDLRDGTAALILFHGPQAYVSPSWYPSKREHGRVVPTWNYVMVQVRGTPRLVDDPDWLRSQIDAITAAQENGRTEPWSVTDAPADFVTGQMKGIIGLEVAIKRMEGKWKLSQNQPPANRHGVEAGLRRDGFADLADMLAAQSPDR